MNSLLGKSFQSSKCKTQLRLGTARIKLLRNKRGTQIGALRKEVAELLRSGQESSARLRVEHVIREQNIIEAYDTLEIFAEQIVVRLSVIDSQKTCPSDLKENVATLVYASPRCSDLPEFALVRNMFQAKYGKDFVAVATELRPDCGVNRRVIEKLSVSRPTGEVKLKLMREIATEHNVQWDPAPFEKELMAVPEDLLDGPTRFTSAATLMNDLPSVPSQKPTVGSQPPVLSSTMSSSKPDNSDIPTARKSREKKVESVNNRPPADQYDTGAQGTAPSRRPPSRSPPEPYNLRIDESSEDDSSVGRVGSAKDVDTEQREGRYEKSSRRESDRFPARIPQTQYHGEEARRASIGVSREKTGRLHTGSLDRDVNEPVSDEYMKNKQSEFYRTETDDLEESTYRKGSRGRGPESEFGGSNRSDRRQSQTYDQVAVTGQVHERDVAAFHTRNSQLAPYSEEEEFDEGIVSPNARLKDVKSGTQMRRSQAFEEERFTKVSHREGPEKARSKGDLKSPSTNLHDTESSAQERFRGRNNVREESRTSRQEYYPRHDGSDEDADRAPQLDEVPRQKDFTKTKPRSFDDNPFWNNETFGESSEHKPRSFDDDDYNPIWNDESFEKSVTTRKPRTAEDEHHDIDARSRSNYHRTESGFSPKGDSSARFKEGNNGSRKTKVNTLDDTNRNGAVDLAFRNKHHSQKYSVRAKAQTSHAYGYDRNEDEDEDEDDLQNSAGWTPKPQPIDLESTSSRKFRPTEDSRSSGSGDDGSRKGTRRTTRLSSSDEQNRETELLTAAKYDNFERTDVPFKADKSRIPGTSIDEFRKVGKDRNLDEGSSRGSRYRSEDPDLVKTTRPPKYDDEVEDFDDKIFSSSSKTKKDNSCDMYIAQVSKDAYSDKKRMSLPGGLMHEKPKYEPGKASDYHDDIAGTGRQSGRRATLDPQDLRVDGSRESDSYRSKPKAGVSGTSEDPETSQYGDIRKSDTKRLAKPVSKLRDPDEIVQDRRSPDTLAERDRFDRQRVSSSTSRYDDDNLPHIGKLKVGKQSNLEGASGYAGLYSPGGVSSQVSRGEKPLKFVSSPRRSDEPVQHASRVRSHLASAKTDPDMSGQAKASGQEHRRTQSAYSVNPSKVTAAPIPKLRKQSPERTSSSKVPKGVADAPSQPRTTFVKPPDLDDLLAMFGKGRQ